MFAVKLQAITLFNLKRLGQSEKTGMKPITDGLFSHF